jgi:hypothetical protein
MIENNSWLLKRYEQTWFVELSDEGKHKLVGKPDIPQLWTSDMAFVYHVLHFKYA